MTIEVTFSSRSATGEMYSFFMGGCCCVGTNEPNDARGPVGIGRFRVGDVATGS